jgi:hypothetical protein
MESNNQTKCKREKQSKRSNATAAAATTTCFRQCNKATRHLCSCPPFFTKSPSKLLSNTQKVSTSEPPLSLSSKVRNSLRFDGTLLTSSPPSYYCWQEPFAFRTGEFICISRTYSLVVRTSSAGSLQPNRRLVLTDAEFRGSGSRIWV